MKKIEQMYTSSKQGDNEKLSVFFDCYGIMGVYISISYRIVDKKVVLEEIQLEEELVPGVVAVSLFKQIGFN